MKKSYKARSNRVDVKQKTKSSSFAPHFDWWWFQFEFGCGEPYTRPIINLSNFRNHFQMKYSNKVDVRSIMVIGLRSTALEKRINWEQVYAVQILFARSVCRGSRRNGTHANIWLRRPELERDRVNRNLWNQLARCRRKHVAFSREFSRIQ